MSLPIEMRDYLQWSWAYATAEALHKDTIRHNARWLHDGIDPAWKATDADLVRDFVRNRCDPNDLSAGPEDGWEVPSSEWKFSWSQLLVAMEALPEWLEIITDLKEDLDG